MLPCDARGEPLCLQESFTAQPHAWPKLWKHHGAQTQADRLTAVAREREEPWLARYAGTIGLEWFFPKILEVLESAPSVYDAATIWIEAGDWVVWRLIGGQAPPPRSTCQAGYKAMWNSETGYPSSSYFEAVHPNLAGIVEQKLPGRMVSPGTSAGGLSASFADRLNLAPGTPVSAAIIDAHAGVPGAGVGESGTLVMVMGTSSCHMLNAEREVLVPGMAGVVRDGILPGLYGYEAGQAAVGDAFEWFRRVCGEPSFATLTEEARRVPPGCEGVRCVDWLNGCRTPLMDGTLSGAFEGMTLHHNRGHLYRSLLEASAYGVRWIAELLDDSRVPCRDFVATGGLPHHNPLLMRIYADVLGRPVTVHPSRHGPALGAAVLGVLAAGESTSGFACASEAIDAMARRNDMTVFQPDLDQRAGYDHAYHDYRRLASRLAAARPSHGD